MTTLLLILIYVIYIGLGVPDSAFGSALPAMWQELNLPVSLGSVVTIVISLFTVLSSFVSAWLIKKFGTYLVVSFSTLLTALALLGFSLSNSIWIVLLSAIPLGFGAGAIDAALNNYVATRYSSLQVNLLHCFYGVGVALSPFVFSFALKGNNDWRLGYYVVCGIQVFLCLIAFCSFPLWKKISRRESQNHATPPVQLVSYKTMAKTPSVRALWAMFFFTCGLEFTCDTWGTTFLKESGLTESTAAIFLTVYFIGMTLGRLTAGFLSKKMGLYKMLTICYTLIGVAIVITFLPVPPEVKGASLFLIGLGNGPTFPNLTIATARWYGEKYSQSLVGAQMVSASLGVLIMPALFGFIADAFPKSVIPYLFPAYILALFIAISVSTIFFRAKPKVLFGTDEQQQSDIK